MCISIFRNALPNVMSSFNISYKSIMRYEIFLVERSKKMEWKRMRAFAMIIAVPTLLR